MNILVDFEWKMSPKIEISLFHLNEFIHYKLIASFLIQIFFFDLFLFYIANDEKLDQNNDVAG